MVSSMETSSRCERIGGFLGSVRFKLYCSYFLSSWGDRMWAFALSIALGIIGGNLQYTAVSGLVNSAAVLLSGSAVGSWIDKTPRFKAAGLSLIVTNSTVALSAAVLVLLLFFPQEIGSIWNGHLTVFMIWISILLCALSMLANVGTKICVTKDWVVVICGTDTEKLAEINSMMVQVDMAAYVLSPLLAGQVMSSFGTGSGCAFIAFWNIGSFAVEYYMLWAIYKSCPELAVKGQQEHQDAAEKAAESIPEAAGASPIDAPVGGIMQTAPVTSSERTNGEQSGKCARWSSTLRKALVSMVDGYHTYFHQSVFPAGLALACLYLSVMAFDGITIVYLLSLGMPENLIAFSQGLGAIMGIVGSVMYPRFRRRIGLDRTGLIALSMEWSCLLLPVASIWLPGSNFDPSAVFDAKSDTVSPNCTAVQALSSAAVQAESAAAVSSSCINGTTIAPEIGHSSKISLAVFLTGIILSRAGLWMADLTISQIFQENIAEQERGVVNGVQNALNSIMDIAKSILVIILPDPRTFGILVIISWLSVFSGYCSYCHYSRRKRGHLLPFHNQFRALVSKDGKITAVQVLAASDLASVAGPGDIPRKEVPAAD